MSFLSEYSFVSLIKGVFANKKERKGVFMYPKYPNTYKAEIPVGDKKIQVEIGKFSEQAAASVLVTLGGTTVHATIALGRKVNLGYFPLSVEFAEKLYAAGTIKGSRWVKRDGRPLDETILKARVIDRSLRPLFPEGITNEVQVINTVLSYDGENNPDMLGLVASALGVTISEIPFTGPVAGLRVGLDKETGRFIFNPTETEMENSDLDLVVAGTGETIVMVEAGANEVDEETMVKALTSAQTELGSMVEAMQSIVADVGKEKVDLVEVDEAKEAQLAKAAQVIADKFNDKVKEIVKAKAHLEKIDEDSIVEEILAAVNEGVADDELIDASIVKEALYQATKKEARRMILEDGVRPDDRKPDEIRPIWTEVDLFPRTHGSAMFKRGATQAVTITTLGSPSLGQYVESIEGMEIRHYMHFYNMPPYASGEAGRFGFPKRREIGHGALAERALLPVVPSQEEFPYTIQVVSEIMSSNGSTSQAAVCGSTMSLMAAGVPIKRPVAGIAMGLMSDEKTGEYVVLSDIQGLEDHTGDMDFKVAGTELGITALQMDIKLTGLDEKILVEALQKAKVGRMKIMAKMLETIAEPRTNLSPYAPKIAQVIVPADKIGEIIGPGGKRIKALIEETGAEIDIDEDPEKHVGVVNITSPDQEAIDKAKQMIEDIIRVVEVNDEFDGKVTRVEDYGVFVEYLPGREGLVHVSNMSREFIKNVADKYHVGDELHVRVSEIKDDGKIGLSLLTPEEEAEAKAERRNNGGGHRPGNGHNDNRRDHGRNFNRSRNFKPRR